MSEKTIVLLIFLGVFAIILPMWCFLFHLVDKMNGGSNAAIESEEDADG